MAGKNCLPPCPQFCFTTFSFQTLRIAQTSFPCNDLSISFPFKRALSAAFTRPLPPIPRCRFSRAAGRCRRVSLRHQCRPCAKRHAHALRASLHLRPTAVFNMGDTHTQHGRDSPRTWAILSRHLRPCSKQRRFLQKKTRQATLFRPRPGRANGTRIRPDEPDAERNAPKPPPEKAGRTRNGCVHQSAKRGSEKA